ncbi:MAG: hypothetical protein GX779_01760 [Clostridia bacterium]|jgi:hypothetical protein|nr:hypothetical protein [Clostridia bacterium]
MATETGGGKEIAWVMKPSGFASREAFLLGRFKKPGKKYTKGDRLA